MERLTYKKGEKICFRREFEDTEEAIGLMAFALFAREEMEEKREKGCPECTSCKNCRSNDPMCAVEGGSVLCASDDRTIQQTECSYYQPTNYCQNCGRKLV